MNRLVKIAVLILLCCGFAAMPGFDPVPAYAQQTDKAQFFKALDDVPLMGGLTEIPARDVAFDKPEGRIAGASAVAARGIDDVAILAFYKDTLPQLGWTLQKTKPGAAALFIRQGEALTLKIHHEKGVPVARFLIVPR